MKKVSPINMQICAASTRFNKYREAPITKSRMLSKKIGENRYYHLRNVIYYIAVASIIILVVYYLPNYFFLEKAIAHHSVFLLNFLGIQVEVKVISENVFLDGVKIVKDCTGVQVIAVFSGLLLPIPNAPWRKKLFSLLIVSAILYVANLFRIVLEFSLVYFKMLPWFLAHYPLSLLLGIIGVLILVIVTDRLMPEFKEFLFNLTRKRLS
jgi:exosortase/archaeosortase family protein